MIQLNIATDKTDSEIFKLSYMMSYNWGYM